MFQIVLHEPEIPNNTGNIGRTCVATGCGLHLVEPLGFDISEKACRRAGLDYWPRLGVRVHPSFAAYERTVPADRIWLFSGDQGRAPFEADLRPGDHLVFGKETAGLPADLLAERPDRVLRFPMLPGERSLNLATAVCAAIYEGVRQCVERGEAEMTASGHLRWRPAEPPSAVIR